MSKLLDNNNKSMLPKTAYRSTSFLGLGADIEKYAILEEQGVASNLHKLNIKDSIYDKE
jgi:hypothetical protein